MMDGRIRPFVILVLIPLLLSLGARVIISEQPQIIIPYAELTSFYLFISILYGLFALGQTGDRYFGQKSPEYWLGESEFIKKVVYIEGPIVIPVLIIIYYPGIPPLYKEWDEPMVFLALAVMIFSFLNSLAGGVVRLFIQSRNKIVRYYFTKAYFRMCIKESDQTKKLNYFIKGVKSYGQYLRSNWGVQFDARQIYSRVICDPTIDEKAAINTLSESFDNDQDKLRPLKLMSKIANIEESESLLIEESVGQRIRNLASFFATIAAIIGSIIAMWQILTKQL